MSTCFFLTGKPRMGKTTAIQRIITRIGPENFGGFYTEEVRSDNGRVGFDCVSLRGNRQLIAHVDHKSSTRVGRYGVDIESFEKLALPAVRESLHTKRITVVDEIGLMQMFSVPFRLLMQDMISRSPCMILGTISLDPHPEIDKLKNLPAIKMYELNEDNRERMTEVVASDILQLITS